MRRGLLCAWKFAGGRATWFPFRRGQRFRQYFPLLGRVDIQRGIVVDQLVEQQITIKMPQGGELASHGAAIHLVGEEFLDEVADVIAAGGDQGSLAFFQEAGKLPDIAGVGREGEAGQAFFDFQVVEKAGNNAGIGARRALHEYARYRTRARK